VLAKLAAQGYLPLPYYPEFRRRDEPESGFDQNVYQPRFSTTYPALRNRFSLLLETHSWKEYPKRVRMTRDYLAALLEETAQHGHEWMATARAADERATGLAGQQVVLDWKNTDKFRIVDFRGYAYTYTPSSVTGGVVIRYDESKPAIWHVPLYDEAVPAATATLPAGGYLVESAYADSVAKLLDLHGVRYRRLARVLPGIAVETFRPKSVRISAMPNEGRQQATVEGSWSPERRELRAGSLYVPAAQPGARLVAVLFEPAASDSLLAWGQFNAALAENPLMGAYVAEDIAAEQLRDPAIAAEFNQRLRDPAFAASPRERIAFFAQRHESWNVDARLYPVYRVAAAPVN